MGDLQLRQNKQEQERADLLVQQIEQERAKLQLRQKALIHQATSHRDASESILANLRQDAQLEVAKQPEKLELDEVREIGTLELALSFIKMKLFNALGPHATGHAGFPVLETEVRRNINRRRMEMNEKNIKFDEATWERLANSILKQMQTVQFTVQNTSQPELLNFLKTDIDFSKDGSGYTLTIYIYKEDSRSIFLSKRIEVPNAADIYQATRRREAKGRETRNQLGSAIPQTPTSFERPNPPAPYSSPSAPYSSPSAPYSRDFLISKSKSKSGQNKSIRTDAKNNQEQDPYQFLPTTVQKNDEKSIAKNEDPGAERMMEILLGG